MKLDLAKYTSARRPLIVAAVLVAAASVVAGREKPTVELVEPPARQTAGKAAAAPDLDLAKLTRAEAAAPQGDPFAPRSFAPPPRQAAAAPQQRPSAPPLPFAYAGKLVQDGTTELFVKRGNELVSIAAGQNIDAEYRVDAISESSIRFTYLPLNERQSLQLDEVDG